VTARPLTGTQSRGETPQPERARPALAPPPQHATPFESATHSSSGFEDNPRR
jgi:hypothetical protein